MLPSLSLSLSFFYPFKNLPLVAQAVWIYQCLFLKECKPSLSVISAAFIALGRSCLLANTSKRASRSSSSFNIRWSSSRASEIRSRSLESTTKMIPWVFWKSMQNRCQFGFILLPPFFLSLFFSLLVILQCLQRGRILSCPPTSQTVKEMFLYSTVSTLKPIK